MRFACVTGRFQPVHEQHLALFEIALAAYPQLIVAVTNPDPESRRQEPTSAHRHLPSANPFSYFERVRLLDAGLRSRGWDARVTVVPFDLTAPEVWPHYVPLTARQFVRAYGDWERRKARLFEQAGYAVTLIEGDAANRISAGDIRALMRLRDGRWRESVPEATLPLLDAMLAEAPMEQRA